MRVPQLSFPEMTSSTEVFCRREVKDVTFLGKLEWPIHRWFRLTASFSPGLVHDILDHFSPSPDTLVLDPFCGVGTVPLVCQERGFRCIGVEINPFLAFVAQTKVAIYDQLDTLTNDVADFLALLEGRLAKDADSGITDEEFFVTHHERVPRIHNVFRWWSQPVLPQLILAKQLADEIPVIEPHRAFLRLALHAILIEVSNAEHSHVSLTFRRKPLEHADVLAALKAKLEEMVEDVARTQVGRSQLADIRIGDSTALGSLLVPDERPQLVITSPPYPNRFSYIRETRPHLFFGEWVTTSAETTEIELATMGGTWGRATSVLAEYRIPDRPALVELLAPFVSPIRQRGELMANYVLKYYETLWTHAEQLGQVASSDTRLAYVIGNSKFYGIEVPSDELLAKVFAYQGFRPTAIERMRRRNSKSGLYEAIVFMERETRDTIWDRETGVLIREVPCEYDWLR